MSYKEDHVTYQGLHDNEVVTKKVTLLDLMDEGVKHLVSDLQYLLVAWELPWFQQHSGIK